MKQQTNEKRPTSKFLLGFVIGLSILAAVLAAGLGISMHQGMRTRQTLDNIYSQALFGINESVGNLEVNLSKLMVAGPTKESYTLVTETLALSEMAEQSLAHLPLSDNNARKASKYFNQVGDWCRSYMTAILTDGETETYAEQAEELYIVARNINANVQEILPAAESGNFMMHFTGKSLITTDLDTKFVDMNENTVEYPELIYDGPFSDGKKYNYRALEGLAEIDEAQAVAIAAQTVGLQNPAVLGLTTGNIDLYEISGTVNGLEALAGISRQGGKVVNYNCYRTVGDKNLTDAQAGEKAAEFAATLGYPQMRPVWYGEESGIAYVNLAPIVDEIVHYTDLVKVKLAQDDGTVLGLEATGYCRSHHDRQLKATISENTARSLVSKKLQIDHVRLAVIPDNDDEVFCYEVKASYKGLDYFIYVDAYDGHQVDILRVVDDEQGSLVM